MGNLCPKPDRPVALPTFKEAILKAQSWELLETQVFKSMLLSFQNAYKNNYDTAPQFARATLISAGLSDISEGLDDQSVIIIALILASRLNKIKSLTISV
jgi:hypothetical protein